VCVWKFCCDGDVCVCVCPVFVAKLCIAADGQNRPWSGKVPLPDKERQAIAGSCILLGVVYTSNACWCCVCTSNACCLYQGCHACCIILVVVERDARHICTSHMYTHALTYARVMKKSVLPPNIYALTYARSMNHQVYTYDTQCAIVTQSSPVLCSFRCVASPFYVPVHTILAQECVCIYIYIYM